MKQEQTASQKKRFIVLDGSSLIYRAFYALPGFTDSHGQPTGAIFAYANMLTKLMSEHKPDLMALAFDKSRHTFRTERYADYKGGRDKTPEELLAQLPLLREFTEYMGMPFLEKDNYEADDIIGTLATQAAEQGYDVLVVTGDRDALQLVRPNLRVIYTKQGTSNIKSYDVAAFVEEFGFEPIKLIDYKGLRGDSSDNIPGVPGVGPKTATKLLLQFGSLENVLAHTDEVSGKKLKENLLTYADQARLSKELATIELHVPEISFAEKDFVFQPDMEKMQSFCHAHELRVAWKNLEKLFGPAEITLDLSRTEAPVDLSYEEWSAADVKKAAAQAVYFAVSGIFSGTAPFASLDGMAVVTGPYDQAHKAGFVKKGSEGFDALLEVMESDTRMVVFGLKRYDQAGIRADKAMEDIELSAYLLEPERSKYDLAGLSQRYLQEEAPAEFADARSQAVWEAMTLCRLYPLLGARLEEEKLTHLLETIELPLVEVLAAMEQNGVYVNRAHLEKKTQEVGDRLQKIEQNIYTLAGHAFNLNSPKQLGAVLFEELGLPVRKKTKTGYSTNAEVLESLRQEHPIIEEILAYRLWSKLKSTYLDGISSLIREDTGRVHTNFNQTVTATGRLSSSDPNLQNIPVRTEEGRMIRALFEPGEGYDYLLSADYSQIELRLLAHMSGDANFIDAFRRNQDIHARTASEVFGLPLDEVTPELRRHAKAVNFGIVYGISDFGLARNLHISRKEAGEYISRYFERYPGVRAFMDKVVAETRETGYVTTMFGRRRELPAIKSRNFNQRMLAERMAMNTPIQGTAADVIKLAMIAAYHKLKDAGVKSRILLQVHDELVLEVREEEREQVQAILKESMEHVVELSVPLIIDIHWGRNWAEAK